MAHIFFDVSVELCYPTASPPRFAGGPRLHMYTCDLHLCAGPRMMVMVPVPVSADGTTPMYPHSTRAQVMGEADVAGLTIVFKEPTVEPCENPSRRRPFAVFKAVITAWTWEAFGAMVSGGANWPPSIDAACVYDPENEHMRGIDYVEEGTMVTVSAHLRGFADGGLQFTAHDISLDPAVPPCNAGSFANPGVHSPRAQQALCQWFATYYPHAVRAEPVTVDAVDTVTIANSPSLVPAGPASADARTPSASARCTSQDATSIRVALEQAFANRDEGPIGHTPVDPRFRYDTPSEPETESELAWLRDTPRHQEDTAPPAHARVDAAARPPSNSMAHSAAIARARAAYIGTPSHGGSSDAAYIGTPSDGGSSDADWTFGAIARNAAPGAPIYAESPAYGTPLPVPSITVAGARSAIRERIASAAYGRSPAGLPPLHEIIDLTQDSTDDDAIFELPVGGVKRCKWLDDAGGASRSISCDW